MSEIKKLGRPKGKVISEEYQRGYQAGYHAALRKQPPRFQKDENQLTVNSYDIRRETFIICAKEMDKIHADFGYIIRQLAIRQLKGDTV